MTRTRLYAWLGCTAWLAACVGTRTGNPYEHAPEYTTSSRFAADLPSSPGTDNGGLTGGPWGVPAYQHRGGDLVALFEHYVALAVSGRGVLTVDIADPAAPRLVGELPIEGTLFQLEAAPDGVTVAVLERTAIDVAELPEAPLPHEVPRLVRVDLRDPTQPRRAFAVDLEGGFVGLDVRGSDLFVTEALRPSTDDSWCVQGGGLLIDEVGFQPATMKVVHYVASATGFEAREAVELPTDVGGALTAGDSYLVVDDYRTDAPLVRWVDFASGSLVQGEPFRVTGRPRAVDREGDVLGLVLEHGDSSLSLELFTLEASTAQPRGRVTLPQRDTSALTLLASGGAIIDGDGAPALLVELADLDAPRVASQLPNEVMRLVEAPTGLLGLGSSGGPGSSGSLVVSLWDASDVAAPIQVGRVQTDWFYPYGDPGAESWTLDAERGLFARAVRSARRGAAGGGRARQHPRAPRHLRARG